MNKKISVPLAGLALLAALAGCNSKTGSVSVTQASQREHALATSTTGQEAQAEGKALAGTCLPASDLNRKFLVSIAVDYKQAEKLASHCEIPRQQVIPFAKEVGSSLATLYLSGKLSTHAQQLAWAQGTGKGDLPAIVKKYQKLP